MWLHDAVPQLGRPEGGNIPNAVRWPHSARSCWQPAAWLCSVRQIPRAPPELNRGAHPRKVKVTERPMAQEPRTGGIAVKVPSRL